MSTVRTPAPPAKTPTPARPRSTTRLDRPALTAAPIAAPTIRGALTASGVLDLQRRAGNRAVTGLLLQRRRGGGATKHKDRTKTSSKGIAKYSGERLLDRLKEMRAKGTLAVGGKEIPLSDDDLFVLDSVAKVETGGGVNALNTWDDMIVSLGFKQVTLVHKSLYTVIAMAPDAFAKHGIVVGGETWTVQTRYGPKQIPRIEGAATPDELRWEPWASRFYDAGMEDAVVAAVVKYTLGDIAKFQGKVDKRSKGGQSPWMNDPTARAWLVETYNNRPAYGVEAAAATNASTVGRELSRDAFLDILAANIMAAYQARNEGKKGRNIITKIPRTPGGAGADLAGATKPATPQAPKPQAPKPVAPASPGPKAEEANVGAPEAVLRGLSTALGDAAVAVLAAAGERNASRLTNIAFWGRHPELAGRKLTSDLPGFQALAKEWIEIRDTVVKGALATAPAGGAAAGTAPMAGAAAGAAPVGGVAGAAGPAGGAAIGTAPVGAVAGAGGPVGPLRELVAAAKHPAVDAAAAKLAALESSFTAMKVGRNSGLKNDRGEQTGAARDALVAGIGEVRAMVAGFRAAGVPPAMVATLAAAFHRSLNAVTPFYFQHNNVIYEYSKGRGESRDLYNSCNISSMSMCLEGLGITGAAYDNPAALEPAIRFFHSELANKAGDVTGAGLGGLRLPEVLALAATAENYGRNPMATPDQVLAAAKVSLQWITSYKSLITLAGRFGVPARYGAPAFSKTLNTIGQQDLYSRKPKIGKVTRADLLTDAGREQALALETYKATVLREIRPLLDAGKQIEVGQAHHWVRLQSVDEAGVVKDDPGSYLGADQKLTWNAARTIGLFWNYIVVG